MKATENNEIHCYWVSTAIFHGDWKDRTIANFLGASLLGDLGVHPDSNVFYTKPMFWYDNVHFYVASCHECQMRNTKLLKMPYHISAPVRIFEKVYIDLMKMPKCAGYEFIVAAKDDLTGITEARALRNKNSAGLAKFFLEQIYYRYGVMGRVVTDNGSELEGAFAEVIKRLGIQHVKMTPYNKTANGVVERGHFILRQAIVKSSPKRSDGTIAQWHQQVDLAVFADKVTVNSVTGYSPYYLLHGVHPVLPLDYVEASFLVTGFKPGMETSELLALRIRQLEKHPEDIEAAAETLKKARCKSREQYMKRFSHRIQKSVYEVGELVLVRNSQVEDTLSAMKTQPRYLGPYQVVERTYKGNYVVQELDGTILAKPFAAFQILSYISRDDPILSLRQTAEDNSEANEESMQEEDSEEEV